MKIVKASNGKTRVTLSKKEWKEIGKTAGWDEAEEIEEIEETFEPNYDEDCFVSPSGTLGGKYSVSCGGKFIDEVSEFEDAMELIRSWQDKNQFYPNIWDVSDHGNFNLMDRNGNYIN